MPVPFRIPVPISRRHGDSHGLEALPLLVSRQAGGGVLPPAATRDKDDGPSSTLIVVISVVIAVLIISVAGFVFVKRRAESKRRYQLPSNLEPYSSTVSAQNGGRRAASESVNTVSQTNRHSTATNIDRNTSIRSIMTLPSYSKTANADEQVLGVAGDRDGVDIILELPSAEEHEALRDEEMETMYQIRLAGRQRNAEREERRRLTQEARERGDTAALDELRARRRAANEDTTIEELRETQGQLRSHRERAVSSVSYRDLGVARHDGSRIRANSTESERVGLLSDAASVAVLSTRSASAMSNHRDPEIGSITVDTRSPSAHSHQRMRSVGSILSLNENGDVSPLSGTTTPRLGGHHTRAGSSPEIVTEADLGDSDMPPPDYEDLSLDDARSGATTPVMIYDAPPDYSGHGRIREDSESGDLASVTGDDRSRRPSQLSSRGVGGVPQLPSLRIRELPQIVIEPSTAHPGR
ncbi:hypothetical protein F5Y14DRAFT_434698 [Nemania sp. NC0429]|nr:hypothetical protein F5Y14DRAFT_434698 [Nemania sp. NC0429]